MILYHESECLFENNGFGILAEAVSARATEELNGEYTLEIEYPISGKRYTEIKIGRLILARHDDSDDLQPFRIYRVSRPISGIVTIYARHVSYDLANVPMLPFSAVGAAQAMARLQGNPNFGTPFTFSTDMTSTDTYTLTQPASVRQVLGGADDSILSQFGGELIFDRWHVELEGERGEDRGVSIRYGKNLTDLTRDTTTDGIYSAVMPFYNNMDEGVMVTLPELTLPLSGAPTYTETYRNEDGTSYDNGTEEYTGVTSETRVYPMDLSAEFWRPPTVAQLRAMAQKRMKSFHNASPLDSLKVSFINLWQTEEYKNYAPLQSVLLGDTVHVTYTQLMGVTASLRVIRTVYDLLNERYDVIELGSPSYTLNSAMTEISTATAGSAARNAIAQATKAAQSMVAAQTELIAGQTGGNYIVDKDASGRPAGWAIMDTDDKATAQNVLRANLAGIGFSHNGYNGPFDTAWTIDGRFNADFIQTGTLIADLIKAGILTDSAGKFYLNMETGALTMQDGTFTGTVNATAGTIGGFTVDGEKMLYGTPGQAGSVMIWPNGAGPELNYGNVHAAGTTSQYVVGFGESGQAGGLGIAADGTIDGTNIRASQIMEIQEQDIEYCAMTWEGFEVYDPTTLAVASYLHKDGAKVSGPVEISGPMTGSTSERVSATVSGLTVTLYKNAGSVTAYIRGKTTAELATASGYVDLITPADANWMPYERMIGRYVLTANGMRGQIIPSPTKLQLGYTTNNSGTAANIPSGTAIYAYVTWTAK